MSLTRAERKSKAYQATKHPTDPSRVKANSKLELLDLNWSERELPEKLRTKHVHRLHPYLGKFIPQLVEVFLRKFFKAGQTIVDPFCGSGTALVQANELGINSVGYDISAFNVLLCEVKSAKYDVRKVRKEISDILDKTRAACRIDPQSSLFAAEVKTSYNATAGEFEYLKRWFAPQALNELLTYREFIESGAYQYSKLLKIILCRSARSARLTTHFDLDFPKEPQTTPYWCYKHSRECYPTCEALKFLERYSIDTARRIEEFNRVRTDASVDVWHLDSREATFPRHHGVVTSPPYVGLIDYHEQHAYAYALLGLHDKREQEIGPASNGSSQKAQIQYKQDIVQVFRRVLRSLVAGGRMVVVANDKADLYGDIADELGVRIEGVVQRHVNRRTGRRSNDFFESVFVWRAE
jgi:DNA modification methylase